MKRKLKTKIEMIDIFHKLIDNEISLSEFEEMIYKNSQLENEIGEDNYLFFLQFNYKKENAEIEIREFIVKHIVKENDFGNWKFNRLLELDGIYFPNENLFGYAKQNPDFLNGKKTEFRQFWDDKKIEIFWTNRVSQFVRHISEIAKNNEKYLYLGTYENSYIHLVVNQNDEIYLAYDVINEEVFFAKNIKEAIIKLILDKEH